MWLHVQLQKQREQSRDEMLGNIYGSALPARVQIERQILRKCAPDLRWHGHAAVSVPAGVGQQLLGYRLCVTWHAASSTLCMATLWS